MEFGMRIIEEGKLRKLVPTELKYVTNGEITSEFVYLSKFDKMENWWETDELPEESESVEDE